MKISSIIVCLEVRDDYEGSIWLSLDVDGDQNNRNDDG